MATQTGECSIDEVRAGDELAVVAGTFRSLSDGSVGEASRPWAADMLREGLQKLAATEMSREALLDLIGMVEFASPGSAATRFEVHVDPSVAARLRCGAWESYTLG